MILRRSPEGSFAIPLEWTDQQPPLPGSSRLDLLSCDRLVEALALVRTLQGAVEENCQQNQD